MAQLQCKANFIGLSNKSTQDPDVFIFKDPTIRPHPEFTISRTKDGKKLSTYNDDTWDLRPYQLAGASRSAKLHFKFAEGNRKAEAKWLMFICMFIADTGGATGMSVATLLNYLKIIRALSKYSQENDINITDIISNEEEIIKFTSKTLSTNILQGLSSLLGIFLSLPFVIPELKVEKSVKFDIILSKIKSISDTQQHPVIPPRIYSNLINNIDLLISDFFNHRNEIFTFLKKITSYKYYGKSRSLQRKLGCRSGEYEPNFKAASEIFGLDYLFIRYHVKDLRSLSRFLTRLQHGCRTLIYIYTGMRYSEGLSLKMECLHTYGEDNNKTYKIKGETSKFIGQRKATSWITSSDIEKAYYLAYLANKLAEIIGKHAGIPPSDTPLFISISYLGLFNNRSHDGIQIKTSSTSIIGEEIYSLMNSDDFKILAEDIQHLEMVNPFRAWQSEQAFKIGNIWRFTAHQFRRSLAFYVAQSAHVSLEVV